LNRKENNGRKKSDGAPIEVKLGGKEEEKLLRQIAGLKGEASSKDSPGLFGF